MKVAFIPIQLHYLKNGLPYLESNCISTSTALLYLWVALVSCIYDDLFALLKAFQFSAILISKSAVTIFLHQRPFFLVMLRQPHVFIVIYFPYLQFINSLHSQ